METALALGLLGIVLGGSGATLLARWLGRSRGEVVLVSIVREAPAHRRARVTPRLAELTERSSWAPTLTDEHITFGELAQLRESLSALANEMLPAGVAEAARLREEIPRTTSKTGKTQIALDFVTPRKILRQQIAGGILRQELTIAVSDAEAEVVVPITDAEFENAPAKVFSFPTSTVRFSYSDYFAPALELAKVTPFLEAVSRFDRDALLTCVEYAERTMRSDADQLVPLISEIDSMMRGASWGTEAILINSGDRALVVHGFGALMTRGTDRPIPELLLKVTDVLEAGSHANDNASQLKARTHSYVSVSPQSSVRIQLEAEDGDVAPVMGALESVFDQGILECAIVLRRQGHRRMGGGALRSDWVRFGKALGEDQGRVVVETARRLRR